MTEIKIKKAKAITIINDTVKPKRGRKKKIIEEEIEEEILEEKEEILKEINEMVIETPELRREEYEKILKKYYGYEKLKDQQFEIIDTILNEKRDVIGLLPTSFGKSACYQMCHLITGKCVIIVSPLISLMSDQMSKLKEKNIDAICLNGENKKKTVDLGIVKKGESKIIYTTPEYLIINPHFLKQIDICLIAIDESHLVSSWRDFRTDYTKLNIIRDTLKDIPILAVTATATENTVKDIISYLKLNDPKIIKTSVNRQNLRIHFEHKNINTFQKILSILKSKTDEKTLVFCKTRDTTDSISKQLLTYGIENKPYHAGKNAVERTTVQEEFTTGNLNVVVCTIAFSTGLDINNITTIIHYNASFSVEMYYQEIGRAGRQPNLTANCYMFFDEQDFSISEYFIKDCEEKTKQFKQSEIDKMRDLCHTTECRKKYILNYFGEDTTGFSCGMCDNCIEENKPMDKIDYTKMGLLLMKLMSSITYNLGMTNYILILRGGKKKNTLEKFYNHDSYGSGKEYETDEWKMFFQLLQRKGYLETVKIPNTIFGSVIKQTQKYIDWYKLYINNKSKLMI